MDIAQISGQAADQPHIAVERYHRRPAVAKERDVRRSHIALPWIIERQWDVIENIGAVAGRQASARDSLLRPVRTGAHRSFRTKGTLPPFSGRRWREHHTEINPPCRWLDPHHGAA